MNGGSSSILRGINNHTPTALAGLFPPAGAGAAGCADDAPTLISGWRPVIVSLLGAHVGVLSAASHAPRLFAVVGPSGGLS